MAGSVGVQPGCSRQGSINGEHHRRSNSRKGTAIMIRTSLIALAAAGAAALALAPAAQAKTHLNIDVGFGVPAGGIYLGSPVNMDDDYGSYEDDCHYVKVKHKKMKANGTVKVWFSKELVCY